MIPYMYFYSASSQLNKMNEYKHKSSIMEQNCL